MIALGTVEWYFAC